MYELVDKELMIQTCGIGDLTLSQVNSFLSQWEADSSISTLTIFSDDQGAIVINKDRKNYKVYLEMAETYLSADEMTREKMKKTLASKFRDEFVVMDGALIKRQVNREIKILGHQSIPKENELKMIKAIMGRRRPDMFSYCMIYNYGVIRGKQLTRQRLRRRDKK